MPEFKITYRDVQIRDVIAASAKEAVREVLYSASVASHFHVLEVFPKNATGAFALPMVTPRTWCVKVPIEIKESIFKANARQALASFLYNGALPDELDFAKLTIVEIDIDELLPESPPTEPFPVPEPEPEPVIEAAYKKVKK